MRPYTEDELTALMDEVKVLLETATDWLQDENNNPLCDVLFNERTQAVKDMQTFTTLLAMATTYPNLSFIPNLGAGGILLPYLYAQGFLQGIAHAHLSEGLDEY